MIWRYFLKAPDAPALSYKGSAEEGDGGTIFKQPPDATTLRDEDSSEEGYGCKIDNHTGRQLVLILRWC